MGESLVTVLIDTYNHERFIEDAIVSVLEQDFPAAEMEILAIDDGSTDGTHEIIRKFEPRVRLLQKANGGQASAFNVGIPEARGQVVAFLDGDDWWARNKLSRVMETMAADPTLGFVGNGIVMMHRDGSAESEVLREGFRLQANTREGARLFGVRGSFMGTSRMTIRRDILRRIGAVPEGIVVQADEYLFTLAAVLAGAQILPDALTYYRLHDANGFQLSGNDPARLRRKQEALAALARGLSDQLRSLEMDPLARKALLEMAWANADQVRLRLDGGWPWETAETEWKIYRMMHPDASLRHRAFKSLALAASLMMPPKLFYSVQSKVSQSGLYQRARQQLLPVPHMAHLEREWKTQARKPH
jgi:glycosyltransferase involved in cell wall biosynthesis